MSLLAAKVLEYLELRTSNNAKLWDLAQEEIEKEREGKITETVNNFFAKLEDFMVTCCNLSRDISPDVFKRREWLYHELHGILSDARHEARDMERKNIIEAIQRRVV